MLLRRALRASAAALAASAALVGGLLLAPPLPAGLAWAMAYGGVFLGMLGLAGFAWVVLTLPPGAPIRTLGLRIGAALAAALALAGVAAAL